MGSRLLLRRVLSSSSSERRRATRPAHQPAQIHALLPYLALAHPTLIPIQIPPVCPTPPPLLLPTANLAETTVQVEGERAEGRDDGCEPIFREGLQDSPHIAGLF